MRDRARGLLKVAFVVLAVGLGAWAVAWNWDAVWDALEDVSLARLLGSLAAVVFALLASMLTWRALLADLGSPLRPREAARLFFIAQLGKYIVPGSLWPIVAQMEMGRELGIPRRRSATAALLATGVTLATGLVVSALTFAAGTARQYGFLVLIAPIAVAVLHPKIVNPVVGKGLRLLRREPLEQPLTTGGLARAFGWALVTWVAYGLHLALFIGTSAVVLTTGAIALAWCTGMLFVVLPAGVGVREVAMVAALAPILDRGAAIAAALGSRVLITVADLACAAVAAIAYRRGLRSTRR